MKKIRDRINNHQWKLSVPNFRKSTYKDDASDKESKRSSGFYDFQEAQTEFDRTHSSRNSGLITELDTDSESDDVFEDAKTMSSKSIISSNGTRNLSDEIYDDVLHDVKSANVDKLNSQFEYDVPRISFKFFDQEVRQTTGTNEAVTDGEHDKPTQEKLKKSEVKIVLQRPTIDEDSEAEEQTIKSHPSEKFVSQTEILVRKSYEERPVAIIRSGSHPNLTVCQDEDDNFYKVPRSLKTSYRLSQSLDDFDVEKFQEMMNSTHTSIEHISVSQVIPQDNETTTEQLANSNGRKASESMEYCKVRSKLPIVVRRPTLLKRPNKAVDTWNNFKAKFNDIIVEHSAKQRVGAFSDRDKITVNLEEMFKNSKSKCKKVFENTGRIFKRKTSSDNEDSCDSPTLSKNKMHFSKVHLTADDIEYKLNISQSSEQSKQSANFSSDTDHDISDRMNSSFSVNSEQMEENPHPAVRGTFGRRKLFVPEGQNGFEDLRRYVKQGGDFCKELSTILQERADAENQYAKSLSKLSSKLARACREGVGGLNEGWKAVAIELEARAEAHRTLGNALLEETAKPLRNLTESQHRTRKQCETGVEKAARLLSDWRAAEAKGKKHSHTCARDNEKLQDAAVIDTTKYGKQTISKSTSLIHLTPMHNKTSSDKENAKLEGKKKKAEDAVKKADIEYYTLCVRAERARLEWESAVLRGVNHFQTLEEERLRNLKTVLSNYLTYSAELCPRLLEATERLKSPVLQADATKDLSTFLNLRQTSQQISEQLLPDFYCEHITLAMNRERRKQALVKLLYLIRQDIERERKSKNGLENLSKAIKHTPNFGTEDSQQSVTEKLYHMKSMLTYLEGARYKVQSALAELDSKPRTGHPLASHITITRDKSGLQQSVLKVPQWLREEFYDNDLSPMSEKSLRSNRSDNSDPHNNDVEDSDWNYRGAADGNSNQPDSDFDEFSSQCSSTAGEETNQVQPVAKCKAIYYYTPNLNDELPLKPGDVLSVYRKQDDGWWLGECNGNVGIFPATYVELIQT